MVLIGTKTYSQTQQKLPKPYAARILLTDGSKAKGILWSATADSIVLADRYTQEKTLVDPSRVKWIKVRRQGRVGRGVLIGSGSGLLLGGALSAAGVWDNTIFELFPDEQERELKNTATAELMIGGTVLGGAIGALVGSKSETFVVNGDHKTYTSQLPVIRAFSVNYGR